MNKFVDLNDKEIAVVSGGCIELFVYIELTVLVIGVIFALVEHTGVAETSFGKFSKIIIEKVRNMVDSV